MNFRRNYALSLGVAAIALVAMGTATVSKALAQANDKVVTVVMGTAPENLDPCMAARAATGQVILENVVETLVKIDPQSGQLLPGLATSWTQVDDKTWRFTLRQGVKFTDGTPFNADSAVKSVNRTQSKALACGNWITSFGALKIAAKAVDENTLELAAENAEPIMAVRAAGLAMSSPNTPDDKLVFDPVGTGPYMLDHYTANQEIVLKRNPDYWGDKPAPDGARYIFRSESAVRAAMVKQGEADITTDIVDQDANDPSIDVHYPTARVAYFRIDALTPPFDDIRVREALNYAFDRNAVLDSIMAKGTRNATQLVLPNVAGYNADLDKEVRNFDLDKAKQLLAEAKAAGAPLDKEIVLIDATGGAGFPGSGEVLQAAFDMFQAAGLNVKIRAIEAGQAKAYTDQPLDPARPPILLMSTHTNVKGDPVFSMDFKYGCKGPQSAVCSPDLDKLIADATVTPLGPDRTAKWQKAFAYAYEKVIPEIWLYDIVSVARINPRVSFVPNILTSGRIPLSLVTFK